MSVAESELINLFSEGQPPVLSARRISEILSIQQSELAMLGGEADQTLRSLVRILAAASDVTGELNRAVIWFKRQPIPGWAGKTAYDLVGEGKADKVLDYLVSVQTGVYA